MYSSVDEVILPVDENGRYTREEYLAFGPERAAWSYSEPDQGSFFSMTMSGAQRLANGNTFICSGATGVLFEVTSEKETVWEYSTPQQGPFGPGGPGGMRPGELFPPFLQAILQMTDDQKAKLSKLHEEVATGLDALLTEEQRKQLKNPMPFGRGGPPRGRDSGGRRDAGASGDRRGPGGFGRPGGPFGFTPPRPGEVIPSMIVESLDLSKKQSTELAEMQKRVDSQVAGILTKAQKSQLDEMQRFFAGGPGAGPPGFGPPRFGPPGRDAMRPGGAPRPDGQSGTDDGDTPRGANGPGRPDVANRDGGPGRPDGRPGGPPGAPGGPGGGPGGPGGGPRGPGGIFICYRYGTDYPGVAGRDLTPGEKLVDLLDKPERRDRDGQPRR